MGNSLKIKTSMTEDWEKKKVFKSLLREKMIPFMLSKNYHLDYDNETLDLDNPERQIFKLVFKGAKLIEISNDDWRDYTEYFNFYINSKSIFTANVFDYKDANEAYEKCKKSLELNLG